MTIYTDEQIQFLKKHVVGTKYKDLTEMFNERFGLTKSTIAISGFCNRHNLKNGIDTTFKTGNSAWNKGMKGLKTPGSEKGWFKKGQKPINWRPVGTERKLSDFYWQVKVAEPDVWKYKHRFIYEKHFGEIPKDHVIIFADTNKDNFDLDNLVLISRKQLVMLNKRGLITDNTEITKVGVTLSKLLIAMSDRKDKK